MLLGGAAAWPLGARAQQPSKTAKIGILYPGLASALSSRVLAFREGLQVAGYREPDNIELLPAGGRGRSKAHCPACDGAGRAQGRCHVPVSPAAVHAALAVSATIPIIALDLSPIPSRVGLIKSLSRPGGQVTGVFFDFPDFGKKWLELLKRLCPSSPRSPFYGTLRPAQCRWPPSKARARY